MRSSSMRSRTVRCGIRRGQRHARHQSRRTDRRVGVPRAAAKTRCCASSRAHPAEPGHVIHRREPGRRIAATGAKSASCSRTNALFRICGTHDTSPTASGRGVPAAEQESRVGEMLALIKLDTSRIAFQNTLRRPAAARRARPRACRKAQHSVARRAVRALDKNCAFDMQTRSSASAPRRLPRPAGDARPGRSLSMADRVAVLTRGKLERIRRRPKL